MFERLETLPPDPILGLNQQYQQDDNPDKINLSVGVYQDEQGHTPIFKAVKAAEQRLIEAQTSKVYAPQAGDPAFIQQSTKLLLGSEAVDRRHNEIITVMTPGGCGALRMGAELLMSLPERPRVWVSTPTWANHFPLLQSAGLELVYYDYYNSATHGVDFQAMLDSLENASEGDIVLLHGCCHNPTGADITPAQWDAVIELMARKHLVPFIDVAYQGFGHGLNEDAYGVRQAVARLPEVLISNSCSKNFGLYRERTGALIVVTDGEVAARAAQSQVLAAARRCYSMSPYHGGGIVGVLLSDEMLTEQWQTELTEVRRHMHSLRQRLASGLNQAQSVMDFDFVARSNGMFCYLGISKEQVLQLRSEFGIYMLDSTRVNIAGLSDTNLPIIIDRVASVLTR